MALTIHGASQANTSDLTQDVLALKATQMAKSQQEIEGQMAVQLIQSAVVTNPPVAQSNSALGSNIDIYV
jgi:hypothetical protein